MGKLHSPSPSNLDSNSDLNHGKQSDSVQCLRNERCYNGGQKPQQPPVRHLTCLAPKKILNLQHLSRSSLELAARSIVEARARYASIEGPEPHRIPRGAKRYSPSVYILALISQIAHSPPWVCFLKFSHAYDCLQSCWSHLLLPLKLKYLP